MFSFFLIGWNCGLCGVNRLRRPDRLIDRRVNGVNWVNGRQIAADRARAAFAQCVVRFDEADLPAAAARDRVRLSVWIG